VRVLYVIEALGEGGTEMSLAELLPGLRARGVDATIVLLKSRGEEGVERQLRSDGFDIRVLAYAGLIGRVRQVRALIQTFRPELIHTMLYRADQVGRLAAMGTGVPVLTSLVNVSYDRARLDDPGLSAARVRLAQVADAVTAHLGTDAFHAVSDHVKDHAVRTLHVRPERITVIPRGRSRERLGWPSPARREAARSALGIADGAPVVVNVGRQEYQKGHLHLLNALPYVLAKHPDCYTLIAGREGAMTPALQEQVERLGINESIRFLGHLPSIAEVLAAGDVFVFPSLYEGMPGAVIEAMALGLPIVANDIGPVREIVEPHGNADLVDASNSPLLASAISEVLVDDQRRIAMAHCSLALFADRFGVDRTVELMFDLYGGAHHAAV
jgi:glycosyltransferase involved in cell wall biosynthesis